MDDATDATPPGFAPELFQLDSAPESIAIKTEDVKDNEDIISPSKLDRRDSVLSASGSKSNTPAPRSKSSGDKSKRTDKSDTRHSSKNEGQHTDRRYICYLCDKLFTRRRSVRDHISKIHSTKTWEPTRSLEIIVDPDSGEPDPPLEEQIAAGGAAPLERPKTREKDEDERQEVEPDRLTIKTEPAIEPRSQSVDVSSPAPVAGKKRPLPVNKKGVAKIKTSTPNKRPKITDSEASTPFRSPSVASIPRGPASKFSRATQSPTSSRANSVDRTASPSPSVASTESSNDEGEIFCICRKGDNHTWMIACDGGCEEWFHGKCVNIRERDGDLIDKYICPTCEKPGLHTTWKRMCRRKDCRKPARVFDNPPSKYCSRECGRLFFVEFLKKGDSSVQATSNGQYVVEMEKAKKTRKKKQRAHEKKKRIGGDLTPLVDGSRPHTPAQSDDDRSAYETDSSLDDDMLPNRGGALRAAEVKALLEKLKTVDQWRELGQKPATPPRDVDEMEVDVKYEFDEFESQKLLNITKEKAKLKERGDMLTARERMLDLAKDRSAKIVEEVKKSNPKQKDICGFDPRMAWCDEEFVEWWQDEGGKELLESGQIGAASERKLKQEGEGLLTNGINGHEHDEDEIGSEGGSGLPMKDGVCIKNRCQRHGAGRWQKSQLAELRFEQDLVRRACDKLDLQERDIRERGMVRGWEKHGSLKAS